MRITRIAWRTSAAVSTRCVRAGGILSTAAKGSVQYIAFINIHASGSHITRIVGPTLLADAIRLILIRLAIGMGPTAYILAGLFACHARRAAYISSLAIAPIGAGGVQALGMRSTGFGVRATLINVNTA